MLPPDAFRRPRRPAARRAIGCFAVGAPVQIGGQPKTSKKAAVVSSASSRTGSPVAGQIDDVLAVAGKCREAPGCRACSRDSPRPRTRRLVGAAVDAGHADDGARVGIGKRAKQDAVDDGEDRRRSADPEGQREQRDEREAGRATERPKRVADVLVTPRPSARSAEGRDAQRRLRGAEHCRHLSASGASECSAGAFGACGRRQTTATLSSTMRPSKRWTLRSACAA